MGNWDKKEELKKKAVEHTAEMQRRYSGAILNSIARTVIYPPQQIGQVYPEWDKRGRIRVVESDTVSTIFDCNVNNITVLNFSSYKNPGGMFYEGSQAQEEMLCHESFLYNVLHSFNESFYEQNKKCLNKALYLDNLLFSPNVIFERNGQMRRVNVITCAAPNKKVAQKYQWVSDGEVNEVMRRRIRRILYVAHMNDTSVLILGAYGCGVFGNNPYDVARIFKEELTEEFANCFDDVIFPIPGGVNYKAFKEVFDNGKRKTAMEW